MKLLLLILSSAFAQDLHFIDAHACRNDACCDKGDHVTIVIIRQEEEVWRDAYITKREWERLKQGKDIAIIPGRCVPQED